MSAIRVVRPARPRVRAAVSIVVVVVLVGVVGTAAALLYSVVSGTFGTLAVFFGVYLAMVVLVVLAHRFDGLREVPLGFTRERPVRQLGAGALLAAVLLLLIVGVPALAGADVGGIVGAGRNVLWFALVSSVTVGVAEELMFRGYLLGRLRVALGSPAGAIVVSSVLFGLLHLVSGDLAQVLVTAAIGALLATARVFWRDCSLGSVVVAHVVYDAGLALIGTAVAG